MKVMLFGTLGTCMAIYVLLCAAMGIFQRRFLYYPVPSRFGKDAQALTLNQAGTEIRVWKIAGHADRAVLYFGGNSEDVSASIADIRTHLPDATVYLLDYRGYGESAGSPTEAAILDDARAMFDLARREHQRVSVMGRSLGTGVAMRLASERPVEQLVLVTPYDSILKMAQRRYPWLPVRLLLQDRFDSMAVAPEIRTPTLVVLADTDLVVPHEASVNLINALTHAHLQQILVRDSDHNTISNDPVYWQRIAAFLQPAPIEAASVH